MEDFRNIPKGSLADMGILIAVDQCATTDTGKNFLKQPALPPAVDNMNPIYAFRSANQCP